MIESDALMLIICFGFGPGFLIGYGICLLVLRHAEHPKRSATYRHRDGDLEYITLECGHRMTLVDNPMRKYTCSQCRKGLEV